jgi:competence protein ComGC
LSLRGEPAGFTLIELAFVTIIVLVIIGLSVPLFRKTYSDLTARDTAFTLSAMAKMVFDFDQGVFRLLESEEVDGAVVYKNARGRFGKSFHLPRDLFFKDPADTSIGPESGRHEEPLLFYPDGRCDETEIEMVDKHGAGYRVIVRGFGNLAQIKEVTGEQ